MASTKTESNTTWTTPRTWTAGELVTAAMMNGLRDQLNALLTPAYAIAVLDEGSNYTTTSTSFVDIDSGGNALELTITTAGGPLLVMLNGTVSHGGGTASSRIKFNLNVDGSNLAADDGLVVINNSTFLISLSRLVDGLAAGSHTIKPMWCVTDGTATFYTGAGTSSNDIHPPFCIVEV